MELFVIARLDDEGNVVEFPQGGGSSAKGYIRAFDDPMSAQRSVSRLNVPDKEGLRVMRVTGLEEVY